ncbi:MAG: hypothetical protein RLZ40_925 [Actinomycetota bacterium]
MYSPALLPSSIRAAPAKKRIWSTIGGISSDVVIETGLPQFSTSIAMNSSLRASMASAMRKSASERSDGVESFHVSKPRSAAFIAASTSACLLFGDVAYTLPVAGLMMSRVSPLAASTCLPSMKLRNFFM